LGLKVHLGHHHEEGNVEGDGLVEKGEREARVSEEAVITMR
jgi:hypothetical protein